MGVKCFLPGIYWEIFKIEPCLQMDKFIFFNKNIPQIVSDVSSKYQKKLDGVAFRLEILN
jgi:hypothetical protein